jgi:hypothetical protein
MIIGVFFNEVGTVLISLFNETEKDVDHIRSGMMINTRCNAKSFQSG